MMRKLLAAYVFAMAGLSAAPASAQQESLTRARDGAVECFAPNVAARTCEGLLTYDAPGSDGQIASHSVVFIQDQPTIIAANTTMVHERDGMLCEPVTRASIESARITMDGAPAPAEIERALKEAVWGVFANVRVMCTRYIYDTNGADVSIYFDGVEQPDLADRMIWIRPEDGYTLGPANAVET